MTEFTLLESINGLDLHFYDNAIRNAIINNFNRLHMRNDVSE